MPGYSIGTGIWMIERSVPTENATTVAIGPGRTCDCLQRMAYDETRDFAKAACEEIQRTFDRGWASRIDGCVLDRCTFTFLTNGFSIPVTFDGTAWRGRGLAQKEGLSPVTAALVQRRSS